MRLLEYDPACGTFSSLETREAIATKWFKPELFLLQNREVKIKTLHLAPESDLHTKF